MSNFKILQYFFTKGSMDKLVGADVFKVGPFEIVFLKHGFLHKNSFIRYCHIVKIDKCRDRVTCSSGKNDIYPSVFGEYDELIKFHDVLQKKWMEYIMNEHLELSVSLDERLKNRFDNFRQEITLMPIELERVTESFYKGAASMVSSSEGSQK